MTDHTEQATRDRRLVYGLTALQGFIGISAVGGGLGMVMDPSGSGMGLPIEMLEKTPFPDFLIPGLVLLIVNGLGSIVGSILTFRRYRRAGEIAMALGAFLVAWIVIQIWWIGGGLHWLQALYFFLGIAEVYLGNRLRRPS